MKREKSSDGFIPIPVATPVQVRQRQYPWIKIFLAFCLFVPLFYNARQNITSEVDALFEAHGASLIAAAFGDHHHHHHHHHRKGRKAPFGKKAEEIFLSVPTAEGALEVSRKYAAKPHVAGSPQDFVTAKWFLELLQSELGVSAADIEPQPIYSAGTPDSRNATLSITSLDAPTAWIDVYYPFMNTALDHSLEILDEDGNVLWQANLEEVADDTDPEAGKYVNEVPTWHGLSRDGEATGKLIYANYGRKQDYEALVEKGVDFTDSIVITRYGGIFRGLKVKGAEELGAAGVLIYSDLRDDGTVTEANGYTPYPNGPARNPTSVQRGSVQYLSSYPGDPTTPGYPAYENSTRTNGSNIPGIPSLPISWANAQVLLKDLEESEGKHQVKMVNHVDDRVFPIWNTMGVIPGIIKDEVLVVGNHRDAWVMGAADPTSGTASISEVIRGVGTLLKQGWKPLRTIVFASWDAEEYGLVGSTEWGEDFESWIDKHVVAYFNLDGSTSGAMFGAASSPSLAHFIRSTAEEIPHPTDPSRSLWDATKDRGELFGNGSVVDEEVRAMFEEQVNAVDETGVGVMGSGSDFTVFLQRIGIASGDASFGSTLQDPVYHYHSVFDTQRWQEMYSDPGFARHLAVAKHLSLRLVRFTDSLVLPLNTTHYSIQLEAYLNKVEKIASEASLSVDFEPLRKSILAVQQASHELTHEAEHAKHDLVHLIKRAMRRKVLRRKARRAVCHIKKLFGGDGDCSAGCTHARGQVSEDAPFARDLSDVHTPHGLDHEPRFGKSTMRGRERVEGRLHPKPWGKRLGKKIKRAAKRVRAVNKKLVAFEKGFIHGEGIKDREWYRHLGVAPGKWLGYGATTFPALTEAFTIERNASMAEYEAQRLTGLLEKLAVKIRP